MSKLFTEAVPKILDTIFSQMHVHFVTRHPEHILLSHGLDWKHIITITNAEMKILANMNENIVS